MTIIIGWECSYVGAVFSYVSTSNLHSSLSPPERQSLCLALFFANGRSLISLSVMRLKNGAVHIEINWEEEETLLYILACDDQSSVATTWDTAGEQHSLYSQVLERQSHCMPRKGHIVGMGHRGPREQAQQGRWGAKSIRTMASAFTGVRSTEAKGAKRFHWCV